MPQIGTSFRYSAFNEPVLPGGSFVPASLNAGVTSFIVAEAGVQWTLYDFGRTAGRYGQAVDRAQVEALALARARQTIAFEAAQAYFRLLAAQANLRVRDEALQRASAVLRDTDMPGSPTETPTARTCCVPKSKSPESRKICSAPTRRSTTPSRC